MNKILICLLKFLAVKQLKRNHQKLSKNHHPLLVRVIKLTPNLLGKGGRLNKQITVVKRRNQMLKMKSLPAVNQNGKSLSKIFTYLIQDLFMKICSWSHLVVLWPPTAPVCSAKTPGSVNDARESFVHLRSQPFVQTLLKLWREKEGAMFSLQSWLSFKAESTRYLTSLDQVPPHAEKWLVTWESSLTRLVSWQLSCVVSRIKLKAPQNQVRLKKRVVNLSSKDRLNAQNLKIKRAWSNNLTILVYINLRKFVLLSLNGRRAWTNLSRINRSKVCLCRMTFK